MIATKIQSKIDKLPAAPGVYFHKNKKGEIIYVGKAANLRNRVRQYFQSATLARASRTDPKTASLIAEISDIDWTELETEADALFLEAELIRRYLPRYNILLRDDKSQQYIRIDHKSDYPTVSLVRRPLDDNAQYFGPYLNGFAIKKALRFLRKAFPYATGRTVGQKRTNLQYHLGLDPGLEEGRTSLAQYRVNLKKLMQYLSGQRVALVQAIERDMKLAAKSKQYEKAAVLRNQLFALRELNRQILFSDREKLDASRDHGLMGLVDLLGLNKAPRRIEGFDISHIQGTDNVASMVVFINGVPDKAAYRKFKLRLPGNDDFGHLHEAITRRFREENRKKWGQPDLVLIDGGRGQLKAGIKARNELGLSKIPMIGLAKANEEIIIHKNESVARLYTAAVAAYSQQAGAYLVESPDFIIVKFPANSHTVKLLQRVRDESHRFAVTYHGSLRRNRQTASLLDEIPGVGPVTRKKLIRHFGSSKSVLEATENELGKLLGSRKGSKLFKYLSGAK